MFSDTVNTDTSLFATYYERLELSDGYYNPVALEIELAKQAYATNKENYDKAGQGVHPNFETLQLATAVNVGGASAHDVIQVQSGASGYNGSHFAFRTFRISDISRREISHR